MIRGLEIKTLLVARRQWKWENLPLCDDNFYNLWARAITRWSSGAGG